MSERPAAGPGPVDAPADEAWVAQERLVEELERLLAAGETVDPAGLARRFDVPEGEARQLVRAVRSLSVAPAGDAAAPPAPDAAPDPAELHELAGYTLLEELARGGMGVVYRAWHPALQREVALKVLLEGRLARPGQIERFQAEARAAARLRHPNLVTVHEVGEEGGLHYLVMDLIAGESLDRRLAREGRLPSAEAVRIAERLARALSYAHSRAILHRDVKPSNVLLSEEGEPVLTDFGLAKDVDATGSGLTRTGQWVGTPAYMPPEQARGNLDRVDRRADVYALGATLYEMLTGRPPFEGASPLEVISRVVDRDPPSPRAFAAEVDRALETIVLECLEKEVQDRYASAGELADDLGRWLRREPVVARPPRLHEKLGRWVRRNRAGAGVLAAVLLLLIVGGPLAVAWSSAARRRASEQARGELVARSRRDALEALSRLEAARAARSEGRRERAFAAFLAGGRWHALAGDDPEARAALHDVAMELGRLAAAEEQWGLAAQAFREAERAGVDPEAAREALRRLAAPRSEAARRRREEVRALLAAARSGELAARPDGLRDAVFAIVRYDEAATVALLAAELEDATARLLEVEREALMEASPAAEAAALDEALALREELGAPLPPPAAAAYRAALGRLDARAVARAPEAPPALAVLAARQSSALGPGALAAAAVAAESLGRIGLRGRAVAVLLRYLAAEADPDRAARAAVALCRLGDPEALPTVLWAWRRFGPRGAFARRVRLALAELSLPAAADTAPAQARRGELLLAAGDAAGARTALDRALALDPEPAAPWALRARAREGAGDLAGALEDVNRALERAPARLDAWLTRARVHLALGEPERARTDVERALELAPRSPRAALHRGRVRLAAGDADGGAEDLTRVLRRAPDLRPEVEALATDGALGPAARAAVARVLADAAD